LRSYVTLKGSTTPRLFTPPLVSGRPGPCGCGCALTAATSKGFSAVEFVETVIGVELLPWQRWLFVHALELQADGRFRFRTVLILVARQNGKTSLVEFKNLWKMFVLRVPLVIGTAQVLDIAEESWDKAVEIVESVPELAAEIAHVDKTNGKKALRLQGGPRWKVAAASRRGGRGLAGDDVNLDELREHQTWAAWGAVTKTTMARRNAQVYAFSNAGDDKSIVLNDLRGKGLAQAEQMTDPSLGLFEWSAPDDVVCDCGRPGNAHTPACRLQDRDAWAQANPALGYTITEEALASALATDPETVFRTECLCQRVPDMQPDWSVISRDVWRALEAEPPDQREMLPIAYAVDVTPERSHASIGVAGRVNGLLHVEVAEHGRGTGWVVQWLADRVPLGRHCAVVVARNGPAGSLIPDLEAAGIEVLKPSVADEAQAYGAFIDGVMPLEGEPTIRHVGDPDLDDAVRSAAQADLGDGSHRWSRRLSTAIVSPLVAVTHAAWGHSMRAHLWEDDYDVLQSVF
jgi:hypothetical protein